MLSGRALQAPPTDVTAVIYVLIQRGAVNYDSLAQLARAMRELQFSGGSLEVIRPGFQCT